MATIRAASYYRTSACTRSTVFRHPIRLSLITYSAPAPTTPAAPMPPIFDTARNAWPPHRQAGLSRPVPAWALDVLPWGGVATSPNLNAKWPIGMIGLVMHEVARLPASEPAVFLRLSRSFLIVSTQATKSRESSHACCRTSPWNIAMKIRAVTLGSSFLESSPRACACNTIRVNSARGLSTPSRAAARRLESWRTLGPQRNRQLAPCALIGFDQWIEEVFCELVQASRDACL